MKAGLALLSLAALTWAKPVSSEVSVDIVPRDDTFATAIVFHMNELRELVSNASSNISKQTGKSSRLAMRTHH